MSIRELTICIFFLSGLLLAGSDAVEPIWPWNSIAGVVLLGISALLANMWKPGD